MSRAEKKRSATRPRLSETAHLLERATKQPGVADLLTLYEQYSKTVRSADPYLQSRSRFMIFSTSDATA